MNDFYSSERDSLEGPHDAEAIERSALKRRKNFVRRDWTCEPNERILGSSIISTTCNKSLHLVQTNPPNLFLFSYL